MPRKSLRMAKTQRVLVLLPGGYQCDSVIVIVIAMHAEHCLNQDPRVFGSMQFLPFPIQDLAGLSRHLHTDLMTTRKQRLHKDRDVRPEASREQKQAEIERQGAD